MSSVSDEEINKVKYSQVRGLALDIDETLAATSQHWFQLLFEKLGNPENLSSKQMAEKYTVVENVPYWNTLQEFQAWHQKAVSSEALHSDIPLVESAKETVAEIQQDIPIVAYITGRLENLRGVTKEWLSQHGFEKLPLIMKPNESRHIPNNEWKAEILEELYPQVRGIVDDNPGLSSYLSEQYQGMIFVIGKRSLPYESDSVIPCEDWNIVHKKIRETIQ